MQIIQIFPDFSEIYMKLVQLFLGNLNMKSKLSFFFNIKYDFKGQYWLRHIAAISKITMGPSRLGYALALFLRPKPISQVYPKAIPDDITLRSITNFGQYKRRYTSQKTNFFGFLSYKKISCIFVILIKKHSELM